jgi:dTMP kinase
VLVGVGVWGWQRGQYGEERYETREMQARVREVFMRLKEGDETWTVVDASQSVEEVGARILEVASKAVGRAADRPLGTLWQG